MNTIRFRPGWLLTVAFLAALPALVGLGLWQLDRADQKRTLQDLYDQRTGAAPIALGATPVVPEAVRYYRAEVRGVYEADREILLNNRMHGGRPGFHVITPLRIDGTGTRVLINRGWVPLGTSHEALPRTPPPTGLQEIAGIVTVPGTNAFGSGTPPDREWARVWRQIDLARFTAAVPYTIQPVVILLDRDSAGGGFARDWKRLDTGIAVHESYAFQWFSLALVLLSIFLFLGLARTDEGRADANRLRG